MGITKALATLAGNIWISKKVFCLWPWPGVVVGMPDSKLTGTDFRTMLRVIKPGDMILERGDLFRITNQGIPESLTYLKHLAVYVGGVDGIRNDEFITTPKRGNEYEQCLIHAVSEGVKCQDILELFKHADELVVVRPWKNEFQQQKIIETAFNYIDTPYDFNFKSNNNALYCTELGAKCLQAAGLGLPETVRTRNTIIGMFIPLDRFKGDVYVADSFIRHYSIVFKSSSLK